MVVHWTGWSLFPVAAAMLAAPPAVACSSMGPNFTRANGQPLLSVEDAIRDAALVAEGEVVGISTEKICTTKNPPECGDYPSAMIFRIGKAYKGALEPTIEVAPLGGCASDGSGGIDLGFVPVGTKMLLIADLMSERMQPLYATARYSQTTDFFEIRDNTLQGVPESEWERYRKLWIDLEAQAAAHPDDPDGWRKLARAMEGWRDYPRALRAYDRLGTLLPQDLDIQAARGRMLFYLRKPEAEAVLSRVVAARPADVKSRSLLALRHYQPGVTQSLTGLDLSDTDLRGWSFEKVDFSGSDFSGADLRGAELKEVSLAETNLSRARFYSGYDLHFDIWVTSLRNADFTGSYVEDIPPAWDYSGIKLSDMTVPAGLLVSNGLMDADLSGARIICSPIPPAKYWQVASFHGQRETWQRHIDELNDASHAVQEQTAALLDASCSEAIRDHVHQKCAPWILEAKRSPGCKVEF